jgi:hypothetical protein
MKLETLRLPSWLASALIDGDTSGHEPADDITFAVLEDYLEWQGLGSCMDIRNEDEFQRPSLDAIRIFDDPLAGSYADFIFLVRESVRKGTLEAAILGMMLEAFKPGDRFNVIAYELSHDGLGWSVNTPFRIGTDCNLWEVLSHARGRWEVYKANYDSRATVAGLSDIGEGDTVEIESGCTAFLSVRKAGA